MLTEPKASYRTVQYEYAYRYTPSIRTISDLDRSRLSDTDLAENASIGADTEYRIDASLVSTWMGDLLGKLGCCWKRC